MKDWKKTLLGPAATIGEAIRIIDAGGMQICLIVDEQGRLLGTVTDGDVRRGILRSLPLDAAVTEIMKRDPVSGRPHDEPKRLLEIMQPRDVRQLPILDSGSRVVGLVFRDDLRTPPPLDNWVVLMAGGIGSRLRPMTEKTPKSLLTVGPKPLIETILESFVEHDFRRFYISVNYLAEQVKKHFGDGSRWGVEIRYLEEEERQGTGGSLSLIPETPKEALIVMNADLLTKVNFKSLLDFHGEQGANATMCVREYDFQVPFGVVNIEDDRITGIEEKPVHTFFVNAGIYVISPDLLALASEREHLDMPEFFERAIDAGHHAAVFPIREYWLDVGRIDDYERANGEFFKVFEE